MNNKTGVLLGISVVAFVAALVAGYFVFFGGNSRPDAQGSGEFTSAAAEPAESSEAKDSPASDSSKSEEPTSETESEPESETESEPAAESEEPAAEDSDGEGDANDGLPAALTQAGLTPARAVCDGTPVLIVESVLDDGSGAQAAERLPVVLATYPNSVFYSPGACPSLRPVFEGQDVYPVVQVFDSEAQLCEAAAARGGNARLLNDDTSYSSPC